MKMRPSETTSAMTAGKLDSLFARTLSLYLQGCFVA